MAGDERGIEGGTFKRRRLYEPPSLAIDDNEGSWLP